jgi:hypothetical protein
VTKRNLTAGDGQQEDVVKVKLWDKPKNLEMLSKHLGLLIERIDLRVSGSLDQRLAAARGRVKACKGAA